MAVFWIRKRQSPTSPPDKLFYKNFITDFIEALKIENPSSKFLDALQSNHFREVNL